MVVGMNRAPVVEVIVPVGPGTQHPHVKPICFRCNNTHRGPCGVMWKCHHCVCIKCNGTGFNYHKGHACMIMETTM